MKAKKVIILLFFLVAAAFIFAVTTWLFMPRFSGLHLLTVRIIDEDPLRPIFVIGKPYFNRPLGNKIYLVRLLVFKGGDDSNLMWYIDTESNSGIEIKNNRMLFGNVPSGFRELAKENLNMDEIYTVVVFSRNRGRGGITFRIIEKDKKAKLVVLDKT
jgi:hypothetical protein